MYIMFRTEDWGDGWNVIVEQYYTSDIELAKEWCTTENEKLKLTSSNPNDFWDYEKLEGYEE